MMKLKMFLNLFFFFWAANWTAAACAVVTTQTSFDEQGQQYLTSTENFAPTQSGSPSNIGDWCFGGVARATLCSTEGPVNGIYYRTVGEQISEIPTPAFVAKTPSIFSGNYLQDNVVELSFTTQVVAKFSPLVRPMSVMLGNTDQEIYIYKPITNCMDSKDNCPGTVAIAPTWATYQFAIPQSAAQAQAEGWRIYSNNPSCIQQVVSCFNKVMSNVQRVEFVYGNPAVRYISNPLLTINATDVSIKKRIPAPKNFD